MIAVYNEKGENIYDFDLDYKRYNKPNSIMELCLPIFQEQFFGNVWFFGYRFKKYEEVCNYYTLTEFETINNQFNEILKKVNEKNWFCEKLIEKALDNLLYIKEIDIIKLEEINTIIRPDYKENSLTNKIAAHIHNYLGCYNTAEYKDIKRIATLKNYNPEKDDWYWKSNSEEEKIWFNIDQMSIDRGAHYRIHPEDRYKDLKIVNKMINSFNKSGDFKIDKFAKKEEMRFRKYFHKYLQFEDFDITNHDEENCNILIVGENIFPTDEPYPPNSSLIQMVDTVEELIYASDFHTDDYKILCFTLIDS
ncbi:MAG: hypothetical protein LBU83_06035 [Bacteroidales bacterium]|jgi:hypothetical protein|nr:hypothetical protein [Bacteroidales bacterium]